MEKNKIVNLYTESNPNPNSLKFVADFMLLPEGTSADFATIDSADNAPLAKELFVYPFVKRVFYMSNFVTVTKADDIEWTEIRDQIKEHIKDFLESGKEIMDLKALEAQEAANTEVEAKIMGLLDEYIRPAVEQDGGAITFDSFNDGIVKVNLQGSCSGCPSSTVTLKAGIENLLKSMLPEVKSVEAQGV